MRPCDYLLGIILPLVLSATRGGAEQGWSAVVPPLMECPVGGSHLSPWTRGFGEPRQYFQETFKVRIVFIIRCSLPVFAMLTFAQMKQQSRQVTILVPQYKSERCPQTLEGSIAFFTTTYSTWKKKASFI